MSKLLSIISFSLFFTIVLLSSGFADEQLTITTYYPSPYGDYNQLRTHGNTTLATDGGRVGIGTTNPATKLYVLTTTGGDQAVKGENLATSGNNYGVNGTSSGTGAARNVGLYGWAGNATKNWGLWVDEGDAIFEGNVGIGTTSPLARLTVQGDGTNLTKITVQNNDFVNTTTGSGLYFGPGALSGNTYSRIQAFSAGNSVVANLSLNPFGGNVGIGTTAPSQILHIVSPNTPLRLDLGGGAYWDIVLEGAHLRFNYAGSNKFIIQNGGNVGIGTETPTTKLQVAGTITAGMAPSFDTLGSNAVADTHDLAESVSSLKEKGLEPGDVVSVDPETSQSVIKSRCAYDSTLLGVISNKPAIQIGLSDGNHYLALAGRVAVKVTNENGPISRGDYITTSSRTGYAMKATKKGRILGVALGEFKNQKEGRVVIYVNPGWWDGGESEQIRQELAQLKTELTGLKKSIRR